MPQITEIPIASISIPHPRERDSGELENLKRNIDKQGLLHPIKVRSAGKDSFELVFGQGRLEACRQLGWMLIPAIITDALSDDELLLEWLTENLQRVRMSSKDKALNIKRLIDTFGYSKKEVAAQLGISVVTVNNLYKVAVRGSARLKDSLDQGMVKSASQIAHKFEEHVQQDEVLDVFDQEKVDRETDRVALVQSLKKGTIDVRKAISEVKSEHKRYRKLHDLALARYDKLVPHLDTLRNDGKFMALAKREGVRL